MKRSLRSQRRGVSLIEGMISAVVLAIGMTAAVQGVLFASAQNSIATKMTRMAAVGHQVRAGLQNMGLAAVRAKLTGGTMTGGACKTRTFASSDAVFQGSAGAFGIDDGLVAALPSAGATVCIINLDDYDKNVVPAASCKNDCVVPRYDWNNDGALFKRMLVLVGPPSGDANGATTAYIVVTARGAGRKLAHRQTFSFFDYGAQGNNAGLDL
jgi:hypothetical protein